jgi:tRNA-dihydrouridine synthase A
MNRQSSAFNISVAPMMGYTDRHARFLYRLISTDAVLYTEMVTSKALLHGNRASLLRFNSEEHPVVLQVGGSDPGEMVNAANLAQEAGYDEVNINVGCPSDRVQSGAFGACLMKRPEIVAECVRQMNKSVDLPVTVKVRTGVDDADSYDQLKDFIRNVSEAGCSTFVVHARKAWLKGLSPKQNRDIPPLDYDRVYQLKQDFPKLQIIINGGITSVEQVMRHLQYVDGVMLGREITRNPWLLADLQHLIIQNGSELPQRSDVQKIYALYIKQELQSGTSMHALVKPLFGLYCGQQGAKSWRRMLADVAQKRSAYIDDLAEIVATYSL